MEMSSQFHTPNHFTPMERAPDIHLIRGWIGPSAGLNVMVKRKIPYSYWLSKLGNPVHSPVAILTELSSY